MQSALSLADEHLTVRDLLGLRSQHARLAVLSACESGIVGTELPNEIVALPAAFLQAGFAGVVASLWAADDLATAMLMTRFYELWRGGGNPPAVALQKAQKWLRDTRNDEKLRHFADSSSKLPETVRAHFISAIGWGDTETMKSRAFDHPVLWAAFYLMGI